MSFRTLLIGAILFGLAIGWFMAAGPSLFLGFFKDDLVKAYEAGGLDMTDCKARPRTLMDPGGGTADCAQDVYRQMRRQIEDMEQRAAEAEADARRVEE